MLNYKFWILDFKFEGVFFEKNYKFWIIDFGLDGVFVYYKL